MIKNKAALLCLIILVYCGCSQNKQPAEVKQAPVAATAVEKQAVKSDEAEQAKQWLLSSIERRYKENGMEDTTVKMYTAKYIDYKGDSMGIVYDTVLTEKQFEEKWKGKYNTKLVNRGSFLHGQQDWFILKVTRCELQRKIPGNAYMFSVIIEDMHDKGETLSEYRHKRDIKVIPSGNSFLIDDILEYDN